MEDVHIDEVINLGIPHVAEQIFESLETDDLIQYSKVSETWKILAGRIFLSKWKGTLLQACRDGKTEIVRVFLDNLEDMDKVNATDQLFGTFLWTSMANSMV